MVREFAVEHECEMSAERFWALRVDEGFDHYFAELDGQICQMQRHDETPTAAGCTAVERAYRLVLKENPVPPRLRSMMGKTDFAFIVRASFIKEKFDEEHPYVYTTSFPVFTDRISVSGRQWCVPLGPDRCVVHAKIRLQVRVNVVGPAAEKAVEKSMVIAYKDLPARACAFVALDASALHGWRHFRGQPFAARKLRGSGGDGNGVAPEEASEDAISGEDGGGGEAPVLVLSARTSAGGPPAAAAADGLPFALERAAFCLAPHLATRVEIADQRSERLESGMRSMQALLEARDAQLVAKQTELDSVTESLQQAILQLKAVSEMSAREREKHRREERRREEARAKEAMVQFGLQDAAGGTPSRTVLAMAPSPSTQLPPPQAMVAGLQAMTAGVQAAAEREAWMNRERAL